MSTEWFDIYDDELKPIGQATREDVHTYGYWHVTFHCWLYEQRDGQTYIIFQRRHQDKDTNPLCYDITVAGHLSAGEAVQDAVREIEEEIGITTSFQQLTHIMDVKEAARGKLNGKPYWDRELSHVFALASPVPMHAWRLQQEEVLAIYAAPLQQLRAFFLGELQELQAAGYALDQHGQLITDVQRIRGNQFVPRDSSYYIDVIAAIDNITAVHSL